MTLTGPDIRILQVHPTRFCNLRCPHCYSSSGPEERRELSLPLLRNAVRDAAALGYNALSISGGEPLLYTGIRELCQEGRSHGMAVTLVTNGTVFTERRVNDLAGIVHAIAISLDGSPKRHNSIRGRSDAFEAMLAHLDLLRRAAIPFAFVYTLMRDNLPELEWAADFAVEHGASMLQVHPVEDNGRAVMNRSSGSETMRSLPAEDLAFAWVAIACLRQIHTGKLVIQFDASDRDALPEAFGSVNVSPLVIEDTGDVVPLRYGFPRSMSFGNLHSAGLSELAADWYSRRAGEFRQVFLSALNRTKAAPERFGNIYQTMADGAGARLVLIGR